MGRKVFSLFELDDFLRMAGAQRVDERASAKLGELLEDNGMALLHRAKLLARHAGRRQLRKSDVMLAARMLGQASAR